MDKPVRLNMGCGKYPLPGYLNADRAPLRGVDVLCDFSRRPFPFGADVFDEIYMSHILEHLPDTMGTMEEVHRIGRAGSRVIVKVPHYRHFNAFRDPTHVRFFTEETFDYFGKDERSYYSSARFDVEAVEKEYEWHIARYIARPFPGLAKFLEKYLNNVVRSLTFVLRVRK